MVERAYQQLLPEEEEEEDPRGDDDDNASDEEQLPPPEEEEEEYLSGGDDDDNASDEEPPSRGVKRERPADGDDAAAHDHDGDAVVDRRAAVMAIASAGGIPTIVEVIRHGAPDNRRAAASLLGVMAQVGDLRPAIAAAGAREALMALFEEGTPEDAMEAFVALTNAQLLLPVPAPVVA